MIKSSTVIKRMIKDSWKPVLTFAVGISAVVVTSVAAQKYIGWDANTVYWSILFVLFLIAGLKWTFDSKKSQIEFEQKQMLRDIERKHL